MYVFGPSLKTNGSRSVTQQVKYRDNNLVSPTFAQALADAEILPVTVSTKSGFVYKGDLQNGRVSPTRFKNTPYTAHFYRYTTRGRFVWITSGAGTYRAANSAFTFGGRGAHARNGVTDTITDIDINDTITSAAKAANLFIWNSARNRAIAECYEKAAAMKFDTSEFLSGLPKTVQMVADRVTRLTRAWMAVRKGNFSAAIDVLGLKPSRHRKSFGKLAADFWLEIQYGWMPLLNDIFSGVSEVNGLLKPQTIPQDMFTVVRRLQYPLVLRDIDYDSGVWVGGKVEHRAEGSVEVKYKFTISNQVGAFLNSVGLKNPLYLAWVSLPFSFVIDWLIPVGTWLNALTTPLGLQFTAGYATLRSWGVQSASDFVRTTSTLVYTRGLCTARAEQACIKRTVFSNWPQALPYIRFPFSSDNRVLNAIALISSSRQWR